LREVGVRGLLLLRIVVAVEVRGEEGEKAEQQDDDAQRAARSIDDLVAADDIFLLLWCLYCSFFTSCTIDCL
jgi:hypothetical protein